MDTNNAPPQPDKAREKDKDKESNKENEQRTTEPSGKIKFVGKIRQIRNLKETMASPAYISQSNKITKLTIIPNLETEPERQTKELETARMESTGEESTRINWADHMDDEDESPRAPQPAPTPSDSSPTNQSRETHEIITKLRKSLQEAYSQIKLLMESNQMSAAKGDEFVRFLIIQLSESLITEKNQDSITQKAILEAISNVSGKIDKLSQNTKIDNLIVHDNLATINRNQVKTRERNALPPSPLNPPPTTLAQVVANSENRTTNSGPQCPKTKEKAPQLVSQDKPPPHPKTAHHPTRLVIQFLPRGIDAKDRLDPKEIVKLVNTELSKTQDTQQLKVVAATYNFHNNLIISTRSDQRALDLIKHARLFVPQLSKGYNTVVREDKKWFKIQIDGICTSKTTVDGSKDIHSDLDLHEELSVCNPSYAKAAKHVVAKPRWMRSKEETTNMYRSSAVFAVDNEVAAKEIMGDRSLAAFGRHCSLRAYQDRPPITQCRKCWGWNHTEVQCKSKTTCRLCGENHHERDHSKKQCGDCNGDTNMSGENPEVSECAHNFKCTNCATPGESSNLNDNHTADSRRCPERLRKYGTARSYEKIAEKTENPWRIVVPRKKNKPQTRTPKPKDTHHETNPGEPPLTFINSFQNNFNSTDELEDDPSRSLQYSYHAPTLPDNWEHIDESQQTWD